LVFLCSLKAYCNDENNVNILQNKKKVAFASLEKSGIVKGYYLFLKRLARKLYFMDKNFFYSMMFATVAVLGVQYYFTSTPVDVSGGVVAGQSFKAPVSTEVRPLFKEIDFIDKEHIDLESFVSLKNENLSVQFSNHGGAPVVASLLKHLDPQGKPLHIFDYTGENQKEQRSFTLVLGDDASTAYNYVLTEQNEQSVTYEAKTLDWKITKKYLLHADQCIMTVDFSVEPLHKKTEGVIPRLFVNAPFIPGLIDNTVNGVIKKTENASFEKMSEEKEKDWFWVAPYFCGAEDRYSAHGLINDPQKMIKRAYFKRASINQLQMIFEGGMLDKAQSWSLDFYMGPKTLEALSNAKADLEGLLSFGWLSSICKMLLYLLQWLYRYFQNYGIAIILLTALVKIPFIPFMIFAKRRMEQMQKFQPTIEHIRAKYRTDVQKQHEELMRFYKDHNISPSTQMLGCLPLFIQMPVFFSLYRVLSNYIGLYQAPFFGWLTDLSAKDPYYILPILMGVTMLMQQVITPVTDSRQRFISLFMPFLVTAIFINFPAGLVLYWLCNNVLTMAEDQIRKLFFA
jgi:YidC/Oxa1 family membrane protein insertase